MTQITGSAKSLDVLFSPAEFLALAGRELSTTTCVVFDVLRATSSMVTALANGAAAIIPVSEIGEALAWRAREPKVLLAGERDGLRIGSDLTGGAEFDLGNSPREFTAERVRARTIVMTTTNGTRALRSCAHARTTYVGALLNLGALAVIMRETEPGHLLLVCSGTHEEASYEDALGAGALCEELWPMYQHGHVSDSAQIARQIFLRERGDLAAAMQHARNGRRLLSIPELAADVPYCMQVGVISLAPRLLADGRVTAG